MLYDKDDVLARAKGMWPNIFTGLCGINPAVFKTKKHQPCPYCGGKDRFRFTDKVSSNGDGGFVCNSCGNGDGIKLVERIRGESFFEAINSVGEYLGGVPVEVVNKANNQASRKSFYNIGAQADHETCEKAMSRTVKRTITPLSMYECLYMDSFDVGVKTRESGEEELIHAIPCQLVNEDGLHDDFCNVLFIDEEGRGKFLARDYTRGSVCKVGEGDGAIYLTDSWIHAVHVSMATSQEVWSCFTPSNLEIVASHYKGDRELRVACRMRDTEMLYMADDANLKVIIPNNDSYKSGMQRKIFEPSSFFRAKQIK